MGMGLGDITQAGRLGRGWDQEYSNVELQRRFTHNYEQCNTLDVCKCVSRGTIDDISMSIPAKALLFTLREFGAPDALSQTV